MRLIDLKPRWVGAGGVDILDKNGDPVPERIGIGLSFNCPCGCGTRGFVPFENPLDGDPHLGGGHDRWNRTGDDFDTLTLEPSIWRKLEKGGCGWHGFIRDGEVTAA